MNLNPSTYERLKIQHLSLREQLNNVPENRIIFRPAPEKWSIKDNVAHLAKYQLLFLQRIELVLNSNEPVFEPYRAENDPEFPAWQLKSLDDLLRSIASERSKIIDAATKLNASELNRVGVHKVYGNLTLADWVEFFLLHEAHHLFTIFQLKHRK